MATKNIIITGGTGFVGANLVDRLVKDGHNLHVLVRTQHSDWRIKEVLPYLHMHSVNLLDPEALCSKVAAIRPDWIFHLAAYGAYSWQNDVDQAVQTNFLSTINLVDACRRTGFEVFVNTGSSSEYGFKDHAATETEGLDPNSYYAVTKASATLFCRYTAQKYGLQIPTLRLYSVYGPFEAPNRLIPNIVLNGLKGRLPVLVNPQIARDYVYVKDVENAFLLLARQPGGETGNIFNVGTGVQTSLRDVVQLASHVFQLSVEPEWGSMPDRDWDTSVWKANNAKLVALGWTPEFTFEKGFRQTVQWFRDHPELMPNYRST